MSCHNCCCEEHEHEEENRSLIISRLIIGAILFVIALIFKVKALFVVSYIILGYDVIINAVKGIKNIFNEYFLMTVATIGAFALGEFPEACAVMLFYQIGEFLSDYAQDKAKDSIGALMDLRSDTANVLIDGSFKEVSSEKVAIGDIIRVLPGEKIPVDGVVTKGSAYMDTKSLTGESVPRRFDVGDEVLSGYILSDSAIEMKATKTYSDSTASKILALLSDEKKAHTEKFITRFARVYTPLVVFFAILLAILPPLFGGDFKVWLYRAILFLVVSCPCALVVSVPLSFFAGIGCASVNGILIKGAYSLERAAKTKVLAMDKTGTLTDGNFCVRKIKCFDMEEAELLKYSAYCEHYSLHPVAAAIKEYYNDDIDESVISDFHEISGKGVAANICGHTVKVGSAELAGVEHGDKKSVYVCIDEKYAGSIEIDDMIKPEAAGALSKLEKYGIRALMLTGDNAENAATVAETLGIPYYASLLPAAKAEKINELKKGAVTAFVGDGINDALVLSKADLGISMGEIGSDAAIEASDAVLTSDNLEKLPRLFKISRKTMRIVYENIILSISVKIIVMLLGALGAASVWLAVFADVGVLILAVINSLRAFIIRD